MRAHTVFIILLILILLVALGPALLAVISQEIGCEVNLNYTIPCVISGKDYGQTFYDLGFLTWYSYLSLPIGGVLLGIWAVAALIAFIVSRRKRKPEQA
jgi:TRAP-type C4-dicarboxylate transport system permease small subunit